MKKLIIFISMLTLGLTAFAQGIELRMVQIDTSAIADVTKVNTIEMLEHEVTLSLYETVMGEKPENLKKGNFAADMFGSLGKKLKNKKKHYYQETGIHDNHPVVGMNFYDAIYFCNKLSKLNGLKPVYAVNGQTDVDAWDYSTHLGEFIEGIITQDLRSNGYRLPTEIEWLYAAKGGEDFLYPGSDELEEVAWYSGNSERETHEIMQKKANGFGLYDMLGNVEEWTFKTLLNTFTIEENKKSKQRVGTKTSDGSTITGANLRDPLLTYVHGKSFKTLAMGCKDILYKQDGISSCNVQEVDRGFRIVRTVE